MASAEARCTRYADEQMPYEIEAVVTGALKGIFRTAVITGESGYYRHDPRLVLQGGVGHLEYSKCTRGFVE